MSEQRVSFFQELKRRNVFRVGAAYVITAWLAAQVADVALESFETPAWVMKTLLVLLAIGFPLALVFAWAFEKTPEGIKLERNVDRSQSITHQTGRKLDRTIILVLGLALAYFAVDKFLLRSGGEDAAPVQLAERERVPSVAVLPFVNMSSDPEQEFFSDGISEEILNVLAQIDGLQVAARTSAFQFKGQNLDMQAIGRQLGVTHVLEGSVRKAGERVRVTAQLIEAANGFHAWSATYDRQLNDIFAIQDEISGAIAHALEVTLQVGAQEAAADLGSTHDVDAYEAYLLGRHLLNKRTPESIRAAEEHFQQALTLDPRFALAYADQAIAILLLTDGPTSYGDVPEAVAVERARPLVDRAMELAPGRPEVLAAKGFLERNAGNMELALEYYDRSLAINPANGELQNWRRMALWSAGKLDKVLDASSDSVRYDPLSAIALSNHAYVLGSFGRADESVATAERLRSVEPGWGERTLGELYANRGDLGRAAGHYLRALQLEPDLVQARRSLALLLGYTLGLHVEAGHLLDEDSATRAASVGQVSSGADRALAKLREGPASVTAAYDSLYLLALAGRIAEAAPAADTIWRQQGQGGLPPDLLIMLAQAARASGDASLARQRRDAAMQAVDTMERVGMTALGEGGLDWGRAMIAAFDGRSDALLTDLSAAIDGGFRDRQLLGAELFHPYAELPGFQAQLRRLEQRVAEERGKVLALICGEEMALKDWQPEPATCSLPQAMETGGG